MSDYLKPDQVRELQTNNMMLEEMKSEAATKRRIEELRQGMQRMKSIIRPSLTGVISGALKKTTGKGLLEYLAVDGLGTSTKRTSLHRRLKNLGARATGLKGLGSSTQTPIGFAGGFIITLILAYVIYRSLKGK